MITSFLFSQTLQVASPAKLIIGGEKTYFNPIIEKETLYGIYQTREKLSQKLVLFSLKDKDLNIPINLGKKNVRFGAIDDSEVFLAPFLTADRISNISQEFSDLFGNDEQSIANFAYTFINANGKYQIQNSKIENGIRKILETNEYTMINFPYLVQDNNSPDIYHSFASSEDGILCSSSSTAFKDMRELTQPGPGIQDIGPILSPDQKYIAFTRVHANKNTTFIIIAKKIYKHGKLNIKIIDQIGYDYGIHCQSPSFSPDSKKIAYYTNVDTKKEIYSIYVYSINNKRKIRVAQKALRKTIENRGPTWLDNHIIVYVKHEDQEKYPVYYATLNGIDRPLGIQTTINKDISVWKRDGYYNMIFTSFGKLGDANKIYNKIFTVKLKRN